MEIVVKVEGFLSFLEITSAAVLFWTRFTPQVKSPLTSSKTVMTAKAGTRKTKLLVQSILAIGPEVQQS